MDDDIDIEEHDVLDNPRIKNIFPDITVIKAEVEDYQEEDTLMDVEEDYGSYHPVPLVFEEDNNFKPFNNKIIIGSKPSTSLCQIEDVFTHETDDEEPDYHDTCSEGTDNQEAHLQDIQNHEDMSFTDTNILQSLLEEAPFHNKIILGTRTHTRDIMDKVYSEREDNVLLDVFVVLEDCKRFLENNPCFCKECEILFPTHNDLDAHNMTAHSFLVAVTKNRALKSTTKPSQHKNDVESKNLLCNHCNVVFPNTIALLRHTYELLPGEFACDKCDSVFVNEAACKAHKAKHYKEASTLGLKEKYAVCQFCTCHFKWTAKLNSHMSKFHYCKNSSLPKLEHSDLKCRICKAKLIHSKGYNTHIQTCHPEYYHEKHEDGETISKFKCPQCSLFFSSDYSVRIHLAAKHGQVGAVRDSKNLAIATKQPATTNQTCPIPKSTLFKCSNCVVHFISGITAVAHSTKCFTKKSITKCNICSRAFNSTDIILHNYQHSVTEHFKVVDVSKNILNRILCKCSTCKYCMDEQSFMTYHKDACRAETPALHCTKCNLWIHAKAMDVHKKIHAAGVTANDFILTNYVHAKLHGNKPENGTEEAFKINASQHKTEANNRIVKLKAKGTDKRKVLMMQERKVKEMSLFYCPTCKCYMKMNKITDKHSIGQCNTHKIIMICKCCGLRFSQKGMQRHNHLHTKFPKLKLKDLKFTNIQTKRKMNPPFPEFKTCKLCDVTFFSLMALKSHACNAEEPKTCQYCKKKFSDLAYNLHIQFHEYQNKARPNHKSARQMNSKMSENEPLPELIKKYRSLKQVWNILYLCKTCDIVIDTYDKVVEHCQDHFSNMESYNVTIKHCNICDLNFVEECYVKHTELHLSDDFDKDSFKILEYKYENLLADNWLDIFASLTKEQIDLILSKSMYRFTRCVRMKPVSNGPSNLTLYQCGKCKAIVTPHRVTEHSQNVNNRCESSRKFGCTVCKLRFAYRSHKIMHENLHKYRKLHAKSFKIIEFHAEKQFNVTELKHNDLNIDEGKDADEAEEAEEARKHPEGLKFIRCQHCGKLIKKHKYKNHIKHHHYYEKCKPKTQVFGNVNIVYNFYKCKDCGLCVSKNTVKKHTCENNYCRKKCPKCPLWFRSQNLASHCKYHEKFSRSNMNIIYFKNGVIIKQPSINLLMGQSTKHAFVGTHKFHSKMLTYYQCSKCSMCIWHKANIRRHQCSSEASRATCKLCGITCLSSRKLSHDKMHSFRNFNHKNINLIQFTDKKIINNKTTNHVALKRKTQACDVTVAKKPRIDGTVNKNKTNINNTSVHKDARPVNKRKIAMKRQVSVDDEIKIADASLEKSVRDSRCPIHNIYYKCKTCKLLFVTGTGLIEHESLCIENREAKKCDQCTFVFHASEIKLHNKIQKCSNNMGTVYLLTIHQKGKCFNSAKHWLYLCADCDIYHLCYSGWSYHFKKNHNPQCSTKTCDICNISLTSITFKKHLKLHHGRKNTLVSDMNIAKIEETTMEKALKDLPNDKHVLYVDDAYNSVKTPEAVSDHEDTGEENDNANTVLIEKPGETVDECSDTESDVSAIITPKKQFNETGIYNCDVCGLNFVHPRSLSRHKRTNKHDEVHHSCYKCNLSFTIMSLKKHFYIHHRETKVKLKKNKADANGSVVESIHGLFNDNPNTSFDKNDVPNNESSVHIKNSGVEDNTSLEPISSDLTEENACKVETSRNCNNAPNKKPEMTSEVNSKPAISYNITGTSTPKPVDRIRTVSTNKIEARNSTNEETKSNSVPNESNMTLNKNKLFKCSNCDVYFLTADDCYDHTTSHAQLDTTEFIACKICDLQFCCEFLGRHMKSHREKTFSVDDLIVVEYHPNVGGEVTTDTYLAIDRLKTKLVTTTTHFDTEDDKGGCVDSTTENLT